MNEKLKVERSAIPTVALGRDNGTKVGNLGVLAGFTPEILQSDYFRQILSGIIAALVVTPYDLRLALVRDNELNGSFGSVVSRHSLDGLLILTWRIHAPYLEGTANGKTIPSVVINDYAPGIKTNIVYTDAAAGARLAIRYLLNRGYRRVGMVQAPSQDSLDARERERILRQTLNDEGIELDPSHFKQCDYFFEEDGYLKTLEMIHTARTLPRALFCFNDDLAIGAIRALREEKILVPQEVAVIGFDGTERGKYVNPPLTTVSQPLEQMGREMVRVLISLIRGEKRPPVQVRFDPQLVIRQSALSQAKGFEFFLLRRSA